MGGSPGPARALGASAPLKQEPRPLFKTFPILAGQEEQPPRRDPMGVGWAASWAVPPLPRLAQRSSVLSSPPQCVEVMLPPRDADPQLHPIPH